MVKLSPREKSSQELAGFYATLRPQNLSHEELARQLNISPVYLRHLESGIVGKRNRNLMLKVFDFLGVAESGSRDHILKLIISVTDSH